MDNKKIPTSVGTIIILIIAITVGLFVWKYEKNNKESGDQNTFQQSAKQKLTNAIDHKTKEDTNWKTLENDTYNFKIQYPSNFLLDENLVDGPEYSVNLGPSYRETLGRDHSIRRTVRNFEISISKNDFGLDNFIKKQIAIGASVEQKLEVIGTDKIAGISAKNLKGCDIGYNCDKIIYLARDKYIYSIYMKNYFTSNDDSSRKDFDRMVESFSFLQK